MALPAAPAALTAAQLAANAAAIAASAAAAAAAGTILGLTSLAASRPAAAGGLLKFPLDLTGYNMSFQFYKHGFIMSTPGVITGVTGAQGKLTGVGGGIYLPIPNNLKDNTSVEFQNKNLIPDAESAITAPLGGIAKTAAEIAFTVTQVASSSAINPFTVVLFKHPNFRTHTFSWKLIPKDASESERIRQIVIELKKNMLPSLGAANLGFKYPNLVKPKFSPSDEFLYKFKYCFIKDVNVNYAAGGVPAFYKKTSAAPVAVELSITLMEIEWQTAEDFRGGHGPQAEGGGAAGVFGQ